MNIKGSVGDFLTEFVAFIIIFGISVAFVSSSLAIAGGKMEFLGGEGRDSLKLISEKIEVKNDLVKFLNSEVDDEKLINIILDFLDEYFEIKSSYADGESLIEKFGIEGLDKISPLIAENEGFDKDRIVELERKKKILEGQIAGVINCEKFYLKIPQGVISEKGFVPDSFRNLNGELSDEVSMDFFYKGYNFKIKFKQLKKC